MIKAPESLMADVLASIQKRESAWFRRPAATWPQPLLYMLVLAASVGIAWGTTEILPALRAVNFQELLATPIARMAALCETFDTLARTVALLGRTTIAPALLVLAGTGSVSFLVLFGAGTALWRSTTRIRG